MERAKLVALVTAGQQGDPEALNELFNAFYNDVYYFALKTVKDEDLACDITQDTFVKIIESIGELREPAAFVTWMKQITYNECCRYFKKKKELQVDEDEEGNSIFDTLAEDRADFIPGEALDQEDLRNTILAMLDELSPEQRSAVILYYHDEVPVKQIAEIQGVSEGTVKSRLNYARKRLKTSVEDYEKKNDIKLHSFGFFPFMVWLLAASEETMPAAAAAGVAGTVSAATGTALTVAGGSAATATATAAAAATAASATVAAGTGAASAIAAVPFAAKAAAVILAAAVTVGGVSAVVKQAEPEPTTAPITTTVGTTAGATVPATEEVTEPSAARYYVPAGCTYIMADGTRLGAGKAIPAPCSDGDRLITADYIYQYGYEYDERSNIYDDEGNAILGPAFYDSDIEGWGVCVKDVSKTSYAPLLAEINGMPVLSLQYTFFHCTEMVEAPAIPSGVTNLSQTFYCCYSLAAAPEIPEGVTHMTETFAKCGALVTAPALPSTVIYLDWTFNDCNKLTAAPTIPAGIISMDGAFYDCTALTGTVEINATPESYAECFAATKLPIVLTGNSEVLAELAATSAKGNVTVYSAITEDTQDTARYVPNGCTYILSDGTVIEAGGTMPETVSDGDQLVTADYTYTYEQKYHYADPELDGWCVAVNDTTKTSYGALLSYINGRPLINMTRAFEDCTNMVYAPELPDTVVDLDHAFDGCGALLEAPVIPSGVTDLIATFQYCSALTKAPAIPTGVTGLNKTFAFCSSLTQAPVIPGSVDSLYHTFEGCTALQIAPEIPESVTKMTAAFYNCSALLEAPVLPAGLQDMSQAFYGCSLLTHAPVIPDGVTNIAYAFGMCSSLEAPPVIPQSVTDMRYAFYCCSSMTVPPVIPSGVTNLEYAFAGCRVMTTAPAIPEGVTNLEGTFHGCDALVTAPVIPGSVTNMSQTFAQCGALTMAPVIPASVTDMMQTFYLCSSLTGEVVIHADPASYRDCFAMTAYDITLTGSSTILAELAATSEYGNVTVG